MGKLRSHELAAGKPLPPPKIIEKLGDRLRAADQKAIAGAGASHIEQMPLGVVDLFETLTTMGR